MSLDTTTGRQDAGRAERGDLRAIGRLLRNLVDHLDGTSETDLSLLDAITATAAEINDNDISARTQAITAAAAIDLDARHVTIVGPASSTYAVTLAAPARAGIVKIIEMLSTTSTNAVTLALTNVVGGSAGSSASFNAAGETLILISRSDKWVVLDELGVTLS